MKRILLVIAAMAMLNGCLWGPGKFGSTLELRKDGSFTLDYKGEIILLMADEMAKDAATQVEPWQDKMARCTKDAPPKRLPAWELEDDASGDPSVRACTRAEIAALRATHEKEQRERVAKKQADSNEMAKALGLPGSDEAANRAFAARLMKYAGWRSVAYRGRGVYDVDYHLDGRLSQDYLFPMLPDNGLIVPFIALRRRADGSVQLNSPAFSAAGSGLPKEAREGPASRAQGRFTVITDGEILTNNSEDGAISHARGRAIHWDITPTSTKAPEMLVKL